MKLTKEQKEALGIDDQGEEIAESLVLEKALELKTQLSRTSLSATEVAELTDKAAIGDTLLEAKREEVKSLATVAELGGDPGQLNPVLEKTIASASAEDLLALEKHYRDKAAQKLMKSSAENSGEIEAAGGIANKAESIPEVGVV